MMGLLTTFTYFPENETYDQKYFMWLFMNTKSEICLEFLIGGLLCTHAQIGLYRIFNADPSTVLLEMGLFSDQ